MPLLIRWVEGVLRQWDSWEGWHRKQSAVAQAHNLGLAGGELDEYEALRKRAANYQAYAGIALLIGIGLGAITLLSSGFAQLVVPAASLSEIHIPGELYLALPADGGASVQVSFGVGNVQNMLLQIIDSTPARMISGLIMVAGIGLGMIQMRLAPFVGGVMIGVMPHIMIAMIGTVDASVSGISDRVAKQTERTSLKMYAGEGSAEKVRMVLERNEGIPEHLASYVTAQADLIESLTGTKAIKAAANAMRQPEQKISAPEKTQYLIEVAADGTVQSEPAKAYQARAQSRVDAVKTIRNVTSMPALTAYIVFVVFGVVGGYMRLRYNRITSLLRNCA